MSTWRPTGGDADRGAPRPLRPSLDRVTRSLGGATTDIMQIVFSHWENAVGAGVADHAQPVSLRSGVLVVVVNEPGWATQLKFLEVQVLDRLAAAAGSPVADRLEVRVRPGRHT